MIKLQSSTSTSTRRTARAMSKEKNERENGGWVPMTAKHLRWLSNQLSCWGWLSNRRTNEPLDLDALLRSCQVCRVLKTNENLDPYPLPSQFLYFSPVLYNRMCIPTGWASWPSMRFHRQGWAKLVFYELNRSGHRTSDFIVCFSVSIHH